MSSTLPTTQKAIAINGVKVPLVEIEVPVERPEAGEIVIKVDWTASTPLDLHSADGALLVSSYPHLAGTGGNTGTVVALGPSGDMKGLKVGDSVFTFTWFGGKTANHKEYVTIPAYLASKMPKNVTPEEAVTVPVNLITVLHTATADLGLELPWPLEKGWVPKHADEPILVWGAGSSVGIYAVQVFKHWGYRNVIAISSGRHEQYLKSLGVTQWFDYTKPNVTDAILASLKNRPHGVPVIPFIMDCVGSLDGTLKPITKLAQKGSVVAVMLPVILRDSTETTDPEYGMSVAETHPGEWAEGVELRGVRTHSYLDNALFKEKMQSEIVPTLVAEGIIKPNNYTVVEGATRLERAEKALGLLRGRGVSGGKLIWKISE